MNTLKTKKAINFDLSVSALKQHYPSNNYNKSWYDIKNHLQQNSFCHRQYSGYVSSSTIEMTDVIEIIISMSLYFKWLQYCVKQFDITIVSDQYSMLEYIHHQILF